MRVIRLARVAAEAEAFRLRRRVGRMGGQAALLAAATVFLLVAFGFLEAAFWLFLDARMPPVAAALTDAGANLALCLLLALPALLRPADDRLGREAGEVRRHALEGIAAELRLGALAGTAIRVLLDTLRREKREKP